MQPGIAHSAPDDLALLRRYAEDRAEGPFATLVHRHLDGVYSAALRRVGGDSHLAEDVAQEVFVALARNARRASQYSVLAAWLYATTRNVAGRRVRTERRRKSREQKAQVPDEIFPNSPPVSDWARLSPVLDGLINGLNERDRAAILLRFIERQTFGEIGAALDISENGARMRVERALDKLRAAFSRRGIVSSSAALAAAMADQAVVAAPSGLAAAVTGASLTAGAGSAALGFWQFLAGTKAALGGSGVLTLAGILGAGALGAALYEWQAVRQAQAAWAAADQGYEIQLARLRALDRKARTANEDRMGLLRDIDRLRSAKATPPLPGNGPRPRGSKADGKRFLAAFPEARRHFLEQAKAQVARGYGSFYRSAALTPGQIERFEALMAQTRVDNLAVAPPMTAFPDMDQLPTDELRGILGDQNYRQFQDYQRTAYAYGFANEVATAVNYTSTPLSPDQATQLARIVANNGSRCPVDHCLDPSSIDWSVVLTQARSALSAAQWKAAEGVLLNREFGRAFAEAQKTQGSTALAAVSAQ